jgi:hypothetical protein
LDNGLGLGGVGKPALEGDSANYHDNRYDYSYRDKWCINRPAAEGV